MLGTRKIGQDISVGSVGLGCMGMSWLYDESRRDDARSRTTIRAAVDHGVTLIDTADIYGDGHNEELVGSALRGVRQHVTIATKGGLVVDDLAARVLHRDGSPAHLRHAVDASLRRLGVDRIDLYYLHRVDDAVPLEESWGALAEAVAAGKVGHLGLSEVSADQAERAHRIHPVSAVQSEFSLWTRGPAEDGPSGTSLLGWTRRNDAALVPFAPLGRGYLTGMIDATTTFEGNDFRARNQRFAPAARAANGRIVETVRELARRHDATPAQVALAWTLYQGPHVIPIPGTTSAAHLAENAAAEALALTAEDLRALDTLPLAVGSRY